ncbi:LysR family transcriptional regulator [Adlercreutzia mucosicola]|nr:LysR family transcriptional regulator [Adlercreutzia mucosicola]MCR2034962.1 LysR family transcriptional regulator [Adlercreutzia mucosicola]MEB1814664.1 LysR family transcriptional regulator [Adlercreutzia mucosicola]
MRTSQLEYFIAVADTLSFTKAAERCHVAQPAISQQIQALEKELGFALFSRSTKGVELTAAGRQYYRDVADVLDALRRADQHAAAIAHGQAGSISIGVASSGQLSTFRVIDRFRSAYPEISINLRRALSRIQEEQLRSGAYDVAPAPPCAFTDQEGLAFAHASREPLSIIMSEAHPLATKSDLTVSDLLPYPHIVADAPGDELARATYPHLADHPEVTLLRAEDQGIAWMMMTLGLGIEAVPASVIASLDREYIAREVRGYRASLEIGWAHLAHNENPALEKFLDFIDDQHL